MVWEVEVKNLDLKLIIRNFIKKLNVYEKWLGDLNENLKWK